MSTAVEIAPGVEMPLLGLGTWEARGDDAYRAARRALELGYRHIDTATMYRNEDQVGRAIAESGLARDDLFITSKLAESDVGREDTTIATSLRLLGIDALDLWLIHWPPRGKASPATWAALLSLRDRGLTRAVGVSNYGTEQIDELIRSSGEGPSVNQIRFGPPLWDQALISAHEQRQVVVEGYSPFKVTNLRDGVLRQIAGGHDRTTAQVVLRWHVQHEIVAIPKSTDPARLAENLDIWDFELTDDEMTRIDGMGRR